jgi:hypothetical protein
MFQKLNDPAYLELRATAQLSVFKNRPLLTRCRGAKLVPSFSLKNSPQGSTRIDKAALWALNLLVVSMMRSAEVLPDEMSSCRCSCSTQQLVHEPGTARNGEGERNNTGSQAAHEDRRTLRAHKTCSLHICIFWQTQKDEENGNPRNLIQKSYPCPVVAPAIACPAVGLQIQCSQLVTFL